MTWTESEWNLSVWSCRYVLNKSPNWPSLSKSRFLKRKGYLCFQWSYSCICKNREFFKTLCSKSRSSEDIDGTLHLILLSYRKFFFEQITDFVLLKYTSEFSTVMTSLYWTMPSILKFLTNNQNTMYLVYWANIKSHLTSGLPKAEIFGRNRIFLLFGFRLRPPKFYSRYSAFGFFLKMT